MSGLLTYKVKVSFAKRILSLLVHKFTAQLYVSELNFLISKILLITSAKLNVWHIAHSANIFEMKTCTKQSNALH